MLWNGETQENTKIYKHAYLARCGDQQDELYDIATERTTIKDLKEEIILLMQIVLRM